MEDQKVKKNTEDDEIDLIEVIKFLWDNRRKILVITAVFIALGLVIALTSTEEYKADAKLLPEVKSATGGTSQLIQQFTGSRSLLPDEGTDAIRPDLYPEILKSSPFFKELMQHEIKIKNENQTIEKEFFTYLQEQESGFSLISIIKKYTIKLPWTISKWIKGEETKDEAFSNLSILEDSPQLTEEEYKVAENLRGRISSNFDDKSAVITVSAEFPDPLIAAQVADFSVKYLTEYVTDYRIEKTKKELEYTKDILKEKKQEYHQAQKALALFRDANRNTVSAEVQSEQQRLQQQLNLAFNVYNSLAQQVEQKRIKLQEKTPVIQTLEPVQIPKERSKPNRALIMVVFAFLGIIISIGIVYGKKELANIRRQLAEKRLENQ
ncbi:MAG: lipopolysaccharide biosynthesis protein [Bacteroidales bacterium]|nr:lipopolysaccharide biosynthesis protein [Bacteroidales bacterium]